MPRPFRLTPPEPDELELHKACAKALDALLLAPAFWRCYPAGHVELSPAQAGRLASAGLKRGCPDIEIHFHGLWGLEIKPKGGRLSKTRVIHTRRGSPRVLIGQEEMFPKLLETGAWGAIAVVHGVDEMLAQIKKWGIPLRGGVSGLVA